MQPSETTQSPRSSWAIAGTLVACHAAFAWIYAPRAGLGRLEALFLHRPLPFRQLAGGQHRRMIDASGDWERLVRSVALHTDALHLVLNVVAIVVIGRLLEPVVGSARLISTFVVCGVLASLGSYLFGPLVSDGASGGAFGLLGLLAVLAWREREAFHPLDLPALHRWVPAFIVLNLAISAALPFIDFVAHVVGLLCGMVLAWVPRAPGPAGLVELTLVLGLVIWAAAWI